MRTSAWAVSPSHAHPGRSFSSCGMPSCPAKQACMAGRARSASWVCRCPGAKAQQVQRPRPCPCPCRSRPPPAGGCGLGGRGGDASDRQRAPHGARAGREGRVCAIPYYCNCCQSAGPSGGAIQLEKWWLRQVPWQRHVGDVSHCGTHHAHMNAAGTKRNPPDPRWNKKAVDGTGSTHFDRLEKSGHLVRKKSFWRV